MAFSPANFRFDTQTRAIDDYSPANSGEIIIAGGVAEVIITLPDSATVEPGFVVWVKDSKEGGVKIRTSGADQIDVDQTEVGLGTLEATILWLDDSGNWWRL